ncbi:TPA: hypothetical protein ACK1SE_003451, partial [Proteus mirabilis]
EYSATNRAVGGSNPPGCTIFKASLIAGLFAFSLSCIVYYYRFVSHQLITPISSNQRQFGDFAIK